MLSYLHIENVALIKQLDIDFNTGFTAITGETGSGKSIVLDSINFVLGQRPKKEIIRSGEEECYVYIIFDNVSESIFKDLDDFSVNSDDGTIMISRRYYSDGKSVSKVNNKTLPLSIIKSISPKLISVNEQHEVYSLLNDDSHINYLDKFARLVDTNYNDALNNYQNEFNVYNNANKRILEFLESSKDRNQKIEFLKFQKKEIDSVKLKIGEEAALLAEKEIIKNSELISNAIKGSLTLLSGGLKPGAYDKIVSASDNLEKIKDIIPDGERIYLNLIRLSNELDDAIKEVSTIDTGEFDDPTAELDRIESRLALISKIKDKYGDTEEEVIEFSNNLAKQISEFEQFDFSLAEYKGLVEESREKLLSNGLELRKSRQTAAEKLSKLINSELLFLDMEKVQFTVDFEESESPQSLGLDKITFFVRTNPGEPFKKLSQIASGGELSRILLALKKVLSVCDDTGSIVFDEIDTGVSGKTSSKIGISLRELSKQMQVICVTHSAQVSAIANTQYKVSKEEINGRMYTSVELLTGENRIKEIARILGGVTITDSVIKTATELIEQGNIL